MTGKPASFNETPFIIIKKSMFYVYYIKSKSYPEKTYVGFTRDLKQRIIDHNAGKSLYTQEFRPWTLIGLFGFDQEYKALRFEQYLKTNAGRIFLKRYVTSIQINTENTNSDYL